MWTAEISSHCSTLPHRISHKCLQGAPHLFWGGVPGSPRASSPEFQAMLGSLHREGPSSSGACFSPASHRGKGHGNMPRLGVGRVGPHRCAVPCATQASHPTCSGPNVVPASLSVGHYPAVPSEPGLPAHLTHLPRRASQRRRCISGHVACAPAGVPRVPPVGGVGAAGLPSAPCERVALSKDHFRTQLWT